MSRTKNPLISNAKLALDEFKEEIANEIGIDYIHDSGYKGNISTKEAGELANSTNGKNVGGQMVRKMIENAEKQLMNR